MEGIFMTRNRVSALVAGAAMVVGTTVTLASPATAAATNPYDPTFVPNITDDLVGVGSDTTQIVTRDLANAYNVDRTSGRIASFAADGSPASVILRAGATAVTRPNGSGAGKKLLYGVSDDANVTFARSSSTLSSAEIAAGLKQAAFAVDSLKMAIKSTGSNAPDDLTVADLVKIYEGKVTNWSEVGGKSGVIKALIPQAGSGTRSFFEGQLKAANSGNPVVLVATETQEHSDVDLKNDPNAIAPFSTARETANVKFVGGWKASRAVYNVVRSKDVGSTAITSIFGDAGFICSPAGRTVIESAGFEQLASTEKGGSCGEWVTDTVSNLKTAKDAGQTEAVATTTALTATAPGARKVVLKANVAAGAVTVPGKVNFFEGESKVGTAFAAGGVATLNLTDVAVGAHEYTAQFVPLDANAFAPSASITQSLVVKQPTAVTVTGVTAPYGKAKTVTIKAVVDDSAATGSVQVKIGAAAPTQVELAADGTAQVVIPATANAGTLTVSATLPATAEADEATGSVTLSIAKINSATSAKLLKAKIKAKQRGVVTVKVASGAAVNGVVTVKSGKKVVGVGTVKNGVARVTLAKLKKGNYNLVASFAGNSNITGSTAKVVKLKVTK